MAETCGACGHNLSEHPGGILCNPDDPERVDGCPAFRADVEASGHLGWYCQVCGAGALVHRTEPGDA